MSTDPTAERSPRGRPNPLQLRDFRWLIVSILTMAMGAQIQGVVVGWQIYAITRDPLSLGLVGLAEAVPFIGVALYAGHVVDSVDRRKVALLALLVLTACAAALVYFSYAGWAAMPNRRWVIYAVIVVCGAARSFLLPARSAMTAEVVPRALYAAAVTWRTAVWQVSAVVGPAIGGLLFAAIGATGAYVIDALLMALAAVALLQVRRAHAVPTPTARAPILASLREGAAFIVRHRLLWSAMMLDLLAVLFGGVTAILPVFADEILRTGPQGLGLLRSAPAVGALGISALLTMLPPLERAGRAFLVSVGLFGLCIIGFALSRSFWLSMTFLAVSGAADMLSVLVRTTLITVLTPPTMLGRISSVSQIFVGSSNEIGAFESGLAARLLGTVPSVLFGGSVTLVVVLLTAWRVPELRALRRLDEHHSAV